jgi:uncharacterized protein YkwD
MPLELNGITWTMFKLILILMLSPVICFCQEVTDTTGSELSTEDAQKILDHHNKARADLHIPPLKWSVKLANYAQDWADSLASTDECEFKHRQDGLYGENIFMSGASPSFTPLSASMAWYAEKEKYSYSKIGEGNWQHTGHYTQMIWKNTTELGVGMATCANGNIIVVANYNPSGNFSGEYPY